MRKANPLRKNHDPLYVHVDNPYTHNQEQNSFLKKILFETITGKAVIFLWGWFLLQFAVAPMLGYPPKSEAWQQFFLLTTDNLFSVALITFNFGHAGILHLLVNSIAFLSFGIFAEDEFEQSWKYIGFLLVCGILSAFGQIGSLMLVGSSSPMAFIGASGAVCGVIGFVTVYNPNNTMRLFFIIPIKLWKGTLLLAVGSLSAFIIWGIGAGGFGNMAHFTGIIAGLITGLYKKY